jgi:hypothetical protein
MCVQNLDDSRDIAIRITYRISLRSSSLWEPRHPSLKVVIPYILVRLFRPIHYHYHNICVVVTVYPVPFQFLSYGRAGGIQN